MYVQKTFLHACLAVQTLDHVLLEIGAKEETISHRLAVYLEPFFPGFNVDCEYNKSEDDPKKILFTPDYSCQNLLSSDQQKEVKARWEKTPDTQHGLRPDVIVHRRRRSEPVHNVLIVECKLGLPTTEKERLEYAWALLRLNEFTSGRQRFTYQVGAMVVFQKDEMPSGTFFVNKDAPTTFTVVG